MFQKLKEIQGHAGAIYTTAFDGEFLYTGSADKFVTRWNLEEGIQDKFAIKFENSIYSIAIHEKLLFVGLANGALHIFDLEERKELKHFTQHKEAIFSITVDAINKRLYVGDATGNLSVWDIESLDLVIYLPLNAGKIRDIAVASDGHFALACQDESIRVFESEYFNEISTIQAHKEGATSVMFSPEDSSQLISGGKDAHIRLWNWKDGSEIKSIPAHNFAVYRLIETKENIASISRDKTVKIWSKNLDFILRLDAKEGGHRHSVNDGVLIADHTFASVGDDKRIILWSKV